MTEKQARETRQIEMVETHNIALSLRRLKKAPGYDTDRWKRALLHALNMGYAGTPDERRKIREALSQP